MNAGTPPGSEPPRPELSRAWAALDGFGLAEELEQAVNVASPPGGELPFAQHLVSRLIDAGIDTEMLEHTATSASAVGRIHGADDGPTLLMFAPIDAGWRMDASAEDVVGGRSPAVSMPSQRTGDLVVGLSAENPKAYVVAILAAARALVAADVDLHGTVAVGLGAGGMPVGPGPVLRSRQQFEPVAGQIGHGIGAASVVAALRPRHAVIAKPGNAVSYEEAGLCWMRVRVRGTFGYTGVRHLLPYRNAIVDAATLITGLEQWLPSYTDEHTSGLVAPQGAVGWVQAGWAHSPAFTPAVCDFVVDLRVNPRTQVEDAEGALAEAIQRIAAEHGVDDVHVEPVLAIPGTTTSPESWIVRSSIRAWEAVHRRPHEFRTRTSGSTDANVLRGLGVETARIGMPPVEPPKDSPGFTMGVADAGSVRTLARILCAVAIDTCGPRTGSASAAIP